MSIITDAKPSFEKAIEHVTHELGSIRTGRATPALLETIQVEMYGAMQPVKAVASISVSDAKTLQIEPWDASALKSIESAILKSDLGITPNVDGKVIRLIMPAMTDETRQKMLKLMKEKIEEGRISVRRVREDVKKKIDKGEESDDEKRSLQKELDDVVKEMNATIDQIASKKEEEITTI